MIIPLLLINSSFMLVVAVAMFELKTLLCVTQALLVTFSPCTPAVREAINFTSILEFASILSTIKSNVLPSSERLTLSLELLYFKPKGNAS